MTLARSLPENIDVEDQSVGETNSNLIWKIKLLSSGAFYLFYSSLPGHFTFFIHNDDNIQESLLQKYGVTGAVLIPPCAIFVACVPEQWKPIVAMHCLLALTTPLLDEGMSKLLTGTGIPVWGAPLVIDAAVATATFAPTAAHGIKKLVNYCRNNFTLWQPETKDVAPDPSNMTESIALTKSNSP